MLTRFIAKYRPASALPLAPRTNSPLVFQIEEDPGEEYPLDPNVDAAAAEAVAQAVAARDAHLRDVEPRAAPQLNTCDPAAFLWPSNASKPPPAPYPCYYPPPPPSLPLQGKYNRPRSPPLHPARAN